MLNVRGVNETFTLKSPLMGKPYSKISFGVQVNPFLSSNPLMEGAFMAYGSN
jgi:hypothetical protein